MKKLTTSVFLTCCFAFLHYKNLNAQDISLHKLFDNYYEDRLRLFPFEATNIGDNRYNDLLPDNGSEQYISQLNRFYEQYLSALKKYKRQKLNSTDRISYDLLEFILKMEKEAISYRPELMPATQFYWPATQIGPLAMGSFGSGKSLQPFRTINDYADWLTRITAFSIWIETAISNFNTGIKTGVILPKAIVVKMIPQLERLVIPDTSKNIFYDPVRNFPVSFTATQKEKLLNEFHQSITTQLLPSLLKFITYLQNDYLKHARSTAGYNALPNGSARYNYLIGFFTTTSKTAEEIYQIGLKEVDRIQKEMIVIKDATGFKGSLPEFNNFLITNSKFLPFTNPEEVLTVYRVIQQRIEPGLKNYFSVIPKTQFEIRQTESFRAASAAAQYIRGTPDGKRAGIFFVPIVDATKYPSFIMENLFLHEAIPGHHYQRSLQMEDTTLPRFRRNYDLSAFTEGWALYTETLGKQLGVYTDPYQYMGSLQNQIHRAIRLVVDVGIHTGKMNREEAIKYMLDNEPITEQLATAEIERYMAIPGQALSYKMGQLKIEELRDKYKKQLKEKFNLKFFHDAILKAGSLPLTVLEKYMDDWARTQK